jgi:cytochrome c oxidase subunit 4
MPVGESWVRYVVTWLSLLALGGLSFGLSFLPLGGAGLPVAMAIALAMATVALVFFMGLGAERFAVALVPVAVLFFAGLLVALTALDVASRRTFPEAPVPSAGDPPGE